MQTNIDYSIQVLSVYHLYLSNLETLLRQKEIDVVSMSDLLNLLDAVQEEEFAYDMQHPRPRRMIDFSMLNVQAHQKILLLQISHEKTLVNIAAQETLKALNIEDVALQKSIISQAYHRVFHPRICVANMAKKFLWEDEIEENQIMSIEAVLHAREPVPFRVKGNASSLIRKEHVLGMTFLTLEELQTLITPNIIDLLVSARIVKLVSNKIFAPEKKSRTPFGVSQLKTSEESFVKFQDETGKDYLILTRESNFYIDDLDL